MRPQPLRRGEAHPQAVCPGLGRVANGTPGKVRRLLLENAGPPDHCPGFVSPVPTLPCPAPVARTSPPATPAQPRGTPHPSRPPGPEPRPPIPVGDALVNAHLLALLALLFHVAACGPRGPPREPRHQLPLHARPGTATPALPAPPASPQSPPRPRPAPALPGRRKPGPPTRTPPPKRFRPQLPCTLTSGPEGAGRFCDQIPSPQGRPRSMSAGGKEHPTGGPGSLHHPCPAPTAVETRLPNLQHAPPPARPALALRPQIRGSAHGSAHGSVSNFSILPPSLGRPTSQRSSRSKKGVGLAGREGRDRAERPAENPGAVLFPFFPWSRLHSLGEGESFY